MKALDSIPPVAAALGEAAARLREASEAKKCWGCGCLHGSLRAIDGAVRNSDTDSDLAGAIREARDRLRPVQYDCLGCEVCYPAVAVNALSAAGLADAARFDECAAYPVEERSGWPPLPGSYITLRFQAPVAICALTDENLMTAIAREANPAVSIVGTLHTENHGIERLVVNVIANPHIRFLLVCGCDSRQVVGHLPGHSLLALSRSGLDEHGRIVRAKGKKPVLRNIGREAVEHFRKTVEVVDLVGSDNIPEILAEVQRCADRDPGPAEPFSEARLVPTLRGHLPDRTVTDPAGYFVIYVDRSRELLSLEHYSNEALLDAVIEGRKAVEVYTPALERGLLSRLDHAAYLGRELARAELALTTGREYVQDAAPEKPLEIVANGCGCAASCE